MTSAKMNKRKNYMLGAIGFLIFVGSIVAAGPYASHAQQRDTPVPVTVENRPDRPVPISGNVSLVGLVRVCPDDACPVRMLSENDRHPFQDTLTVNIPAGSNNFSNILLVPNGKRLVIEYLAAETNLPPGQKINILSIGTTVNGNFVPYYLPAVKTAKDGPLDQFLTNQLVRLYADPGTQVVVFFARNGTNGVAGTDVAISGYLVEL